MQISINANRCEPSPMRKFHPYAVAAEAQGKKIYHLNIGQPDLPTPPAYYEAIRNFDEKTLAYDASPGNAGLIKAVQSFSREKQVKFSTYASKCIDNEVLMYMRKIKQTENSELSKSQKAYQNIQKFRKQGEVDRDYKLELYAELEEKYNIIVPRKQK